MSISLTPTYSYASAVAVDPEYLPGGSKNSNGSVTGGGGLPVTQVTGTSMAITIDPSYLPGGSNYQAPQAQTVIGGGGESGTQATAGAGNLTDIDIIDAMATPGSFIYTPQADTATPEEDEEEQAPAAAPAQPETPAPSPEPAQPAPSNVGNLIFSPDFKVEPATGETLPVPDELMPIFEKVAKAHDLPVALLLGMARRESNFKNSAVSRSGAQGIMQLMPKTAQGLKVTDSFDPEQNIDGGARYIKEMLNRFDNNIVLALSAYNAGPTRVKIGQPPLTFTVNYINKVLGYAQQYGLKIPQ